MAQMNTSSVKADPAVRAARKAAQNARLAAKAEKPDDYPALYAAQPAQVEKAAKDSAIRKQVAVARAAAVRGAISDATSAAATFEGE